MALVYLDGFEHQDSRRYTTVSNLMGFPATTRTGQGNSAQFGNNSGQFYKYFRVLPATSQVFYGCAVMMVGNGSQPVISLLNDVRTASLLDITMTFDGTLLTPLLKKGAGGATLVTSTVKIPASVWFHVGVAATVSATGSGTFYVNETAVGTFSNQDIRNGGTTDLTGGFKISWGYGGGNYSYLDDMFIFDSSGSRNNVWPGDMVIRTLFPNAVGSSTQWTVSPSGANWAAVDEVGSGGADYVFTNTVGNTDLYGCTDLPASGVYGVQAVQVAGVAAKSDAGTGNIALLNRANSVTTEGPNVPLTLSNDPYYAPFDEASSGVAWTTALVNGMEAGIRAK
jgi:hypothetical protein